MPRAPPAIASREDVVRPYNPSTDTQMVKMLVGQGVMEGLAYANQRVYSHPLVLLIWTFLSLTLDYLLNWLPVRGMPLSYVAPLIGFALTAVPILAGTEYLHRPTFTRLLREKLGAPDLVAIDRYYSLDPRSRVMVFEHEGHISGLVAVDGARAGQGLKSVLGAEEGQLGEQEGVIEEIGFEKQSPRGTQSEREGLRKRSVRSSTDAITRSNGSLVQIRHLDVDIVVRRAGVATELLVAVLDHAFGISPCPGSKDILKPAEKVVLLTNPLSPGGEKLLRKCGFVPVGQGEAEDWVKAEKVGLFGWKGRWLGVSRSEWRAKREVLFAKK